MHTEPRNGASIDRIYLHTNEGPESEGGARNLVGYLSRISGGYNRVRDDKETVIAANDDMIVWAQGGDNTHCLSICIIGYSAQTGAEWGDPYSAAAIEGTAQEVAAWCRAYNVPATHVDPPGPGSTPIERGIAMHADDHAAASEGHTDPGVNFPITAFVARVNAILHPAPVVKKPSISWRAAAALIAFLKAVTARPIKLGDRGPKVTKLNALLTKHGYHVAGSAFGRATQIALHAFKEAHKLKNRDGKVCGRACLLALYKRK